MRSSRCSALFLAALLVSGAAWAGDPVPLAKGQPAPVAGVLLDTERAAEIAARCQAAESERDELRLSLQQEDALPKGKVLVIGAAVVFGLGLLIGGAVVALAK